LPPGRARAYEIDRLAMTELGTGTEGVAVVPGVHLLRHAGDQLGLASSTAEPASPPSQPVGRP